MGDLFAASLETNVDTKKYFFLSVYFSFIAFVSKKHRVLGVWIEPIYAQAINVML